MIGHERCTMNSTMITRIVPRFILLPMVHSDPTTSSFHVVNTTQGSCPQQALQHFLAQLVYWNFIESHTELKTISTWCLEHLQQVPSEGNFTAWLASFSSKQVEHQQRPKRVTSHGVIAEIATKISSVAGQRFVLPDDRLIFPRRVDNQMTIAQLRNVTHFFGSFNWNEIRKAVVCQIFREMTSKCNFTCQGWCNPTPPP